MVPPSSHRISRVRRYSGTARRRLSSPTGLSPSLDGFSIPLRSTSCMACSGPNTTVKNWVWPLPLSLATTHGISVDFFSSGYLDVSVPQVPRSVPMDSVQAPWFFTMGVAPFGNLRI